MMGEANQKRVHPFSVPGLVNHSKSFFISEELDRAYDCVYTDNSSHSRVKEILELLLESPVSHKNESDGQTPHV